MLWQLGSRTQIRILRWHPISSNTSNKQQQQVGQKWYGNLSGGDRFGRLGPEQKKTIQTRKKSKKNVEIVLFVAVPTGIFSSKTELSWPLVPPIGALRTEKTHPIASNTTKKQQQQVGQSQMSRARGSRWPPNLCGGYSYGTASNAQRSGPKLPAGPTSLASVMAETAQNGP